MLHRCVLEAFELVWTAKQKGAQQYSHTTVALLEESKLAFGQPADSTEVLRTLYQSTETHTLKVVSPYYY